MTSDSLVIVELIFPSGAVFRRSKPMTQQRAEEVSKLYADFTPKIVPAEKYIVAKPTKTESLENIKTNNQYKSRVE